MLLCTFPIRIDVPLEGDLLLIGDCSKQISQVPSMGLEDIWF